MDSPNPALPSAPESSTQEPQPAAQASTSAAPPSAPAAPEPQSIREDQVQNAVAFLSHPRVSVFPPWNGYDRPDHLKPLLHGHSGLASAWDCILEITVEAATLVWLPRTQPDAGRLVRRLLGPALRPGRLLLSEEHFLTRRVSCDVRCIFTHHPSYSGSANITATL